MFHPRGCSGSVLEVWHSEKSFQKKMIKRCTTGIIFAYHLVVSQGLTVTWLAVGMYLIEMSYCKVFVMGHRMRQSSHKFSSDPFFFFLSGKGRCITLVPHTRWFYWLCAGITSRVCQAQSRILLDFVSSPWEEIVGVTPQIYWGWSLVI